MKKIALSLFASLLFISFSYKGLAQCKSEECLAKLNNGFTFLKSYNMEKEGDQMEYSYVFSKETNYMIMLCNNNDKRIVVTLYDANKKIIATNYDKKNDKYYPTLVYNCKATGIYYLKYSFLEEPACCVGVLAFKK